MSRTTPRIIIGTRSSTLAMAQTREVIGLLENRQPGLAVEVVTIKTAGDIDRTSPLPAMGGYGLFTRAVEEALLDGTIDMAVHSAKDLPSQMSSGLSIAAVPSRLRSNDVLLHPDGTTLENLPDRARIGTGSPRRRAQLLNRRPDLRVENIRGNVETRLKKLEEGRYDALVLALAGLTRSGLRRRAPVSDIFDIEFFVPAAGQGALIVQARSGDRAVHRLASSIDDPPSRRCLEAERLLLSRLGAGCSAALGVHALIEGTDIRLRAVVLDNAGKTRIFTDHAIDLNRDTKELVETVSNRLLEQGAGRLLEDGHE